MVCKSLDTLYKGMSRGSSMDGGEEKGFGLTKDRKCFSFLYVPVLLTLVDGAGRL